MRGGVTRFAPILGAEVRDARLAGWSNALARVLQ
jgi:hypothetical protein